MKTLEEIALQVASDIGLGTTVPQQTNLTEFARRLVAALGAQEPVAWVTDYELGNVNIGFSSDMPARAMRISPAFPAKQVVYLYAAPYTKEGWQMVPKEPTPCEHVWVRDQEAITHHCCQLCGAVKRDSAAPEYKP